MIKAIIFDLDETLWANSAFVRMARTNSIKAMQKAGLRVGFRKCYRTLMQILREKGSNYQRPFQLLLRRLGYKPSAAIIAAGVAAYHDTKATLKNYLREDATLILQALRERHLKLYVFSRGYPIKQWDKIHRLGLASIIHDAYVTSSKNASALVRALNYFGCRPDEVVYVGDREDEDIKPAHSLGIKTIRLRIGSYAKAHNPSAADRTARSWRGIYRAINALLRESETCNK